MKDPPETSGKPNTDYSKKLRRFMPGRAAMKTPVLMPKAPILSLRSWSIRELRLASRIAFTLWYC